MALVPETLTDLIFWLLVGTSFFTSFLTTAAGIGGGVTLLAIMAQVMPPFALIPVHGVVQFGSNFSRFAIMFKDIDRFFLGWFLVGSIVGAAAGARIVIALPTGVLQTVLGLFILFSVWGPKPSGWHTNTASIVGAGAVTTLGSLFVGATGPLVMALLGPFGYDRMTKVATFAGVMVIQHGLKAIVFGLVGFAFYSFVPLMLLMIVAGFLGTIAGRHVLLRQSDARFERILSLILTALALRLLWQAAEGYLAAS